MQKISQETDILLQDYLEGKLSEEKRRKIEFGLEKSEELRNRLEILKLLQQSMSHSSLMQPSANFTQRVMSNLHTMSSAQSLSPKNGLILLGGILIAIGIAISMLNTGLFNSMNGMLSFENFQLPQGLALPQVPSIPINGKIILNVIIALNIGLAFLLLDRTILKPLFNRRSGIQF